MARKKSGRSSTDKANPDSAANDTFRYRQAIQQDKWAERLARKKKRDQLESGHSKGR